ncbi:MAG TPA: S4 domain-containing protein, partial [Bacteroidota bacterium]|nr:S4 domain-containing protein [Bacteroidota bacterium]
PYRFYQFWYNTDDRDTGKYLRYFTLLSRDRIEEAERLSAAAPEKREAQKLLAEEVTKMVHGESALEQAIKASQVLFGGELDGVSPEHLLDIFSEVPSVELSKDKLAGDGLPFLDLMVAASVAKSKGEARRLIEGGGMYLNNRRVSEVDAKVAIGTSISGKILILRKGAKNYTLVKLV